MENLKLLSVRLDPEALRAIEKLMDRHSFLKRNSIINQLLSTLMRCADDQTIWSMLSIPFPYENGFVVKFEKDAEVLRQRSKETKSEDI